MTDETDYSAIGEVIATAIQAVYALKNHTHSGYLSSSHNTDSSAHDLNKSMNIGYGTLGGTTTAYTVSIPGVTLTDGTIIAVYNEVGANLANATLDVNSLGAKPLYNQSTAISKGRMPANVTVLLLYNTTLVNTGCWQIIYSYGANSTYTAASASPLADAASASVGTGSKYAREDHVHPKSSIYAESSHSHSISDVTNLQTSLDGKASSSHNHTVANISNASTVAVVVTYTDNTTETLTLLKQTS